MDDQPLVACGHCGSRNRRTSEQCFICARPLTGLEVEAPDAPAASSPKPVLPPDSAQSSVHRDAAETMALGAGPDELEAEPRQWDAKRRRTALAAAAAAGTLALGTGLWMARDEDPASDPFALHAAVTEEPDLAWTWNAEQPIRVAFAMDQGALVLLSGGEVVALDEEGEERWRQDIPLAGYAVHDAPTNVVHVMGSGPDGGTITAVDLETGQQLWAVPGSWVTTMEEATVVVAEDEVRRIDTQDGSEIWSVGLDEFGAVSEDGVYGFEDDGDLHGWDLDGSEMWVSDADVDNSAMGPGSDVVALDDFIAVTGPMSEVVGIDPATGEELWRHDPGYEGGVGSIEPDLAFVFPPHEQTLGPSSADDGVDSAPEISVYDRDGEVATVPVAQNSFFFPFAIELQGAPHFVEMDSGLIYDEDFKEVGTVPLGHAYPTLTGVYDMTGGGISYVPYGAEDPTWTLDTGSTEERMNLTPGDEFFLVNEGKTLSLYR